MTMSTRYIKIGPGGITFTDIYGVTRSTGNRHFFISASGNAKNVGLIEIRVQDGDSHKLWGYITTAEWLNISKSFKWALMQQPDISGD